MNNKVNRFKELRINNNISQRALADKLNISFRGLQLIESDLNKDIKSSTLIKYARYFNVSTDYLLGLIDDVY